MISSIRIGDIFEYNPTFKDTPDMYLIPFNRQKSLLISGMLYVIQIEVNID
jgi:hypothetical protein